VVNEEENFKADIEAISNIPIVPKLLEVICRTTGMGFAAIARVTEDRWITCSVRDEILFGLTPGNELKVETTICHEIRQSGEAVVIDHVDNDPNFCNHHTPAMYGFKSYISVPILRRDGTFFGTLCAIDPKPAKLNNTETIGMFNLFAELISFHLHSVEHASITEKMLLEEQKTAQARDQFIAILGHDLLNPVSAVMNASQIMLRLPLDDRLARLGNIIQSSSYRMKALVENILDFARGRLGDGMTINPNPNEQMDGVLNQVINELRVAWPERVIITEFNLDGPVYSDGKRIAQLFSNLLGNALTHGKKDTPVKVVAISSDGEFRLSVTNAGNKIPATTMERLFKPFARGEVKPGQQGLGLGLYIASEIAHAHGGKLNVTSTADETCFTLLMPASQS
jgi:signal transduction histidine kinase